MIGEHHIHICIINCMKLLRENMKVNSIRNLRSGTRLASFGAYMFSPVKGNGARVSFILKLSTCLHMNARSI